MENLIYNWILPNWGRKIIAFITAVIIWVFVNHSITSTKTLSGIPVRVVNMPADKTIEGLLPNGILDRRLTLTLSGTKQIIENIEPSDLEIVLDATNATDEWIVQVGKKNLVGLNPDIDIHHHITQIDHQEFLIKLSKMITVKIPITIHIPAGQLPKEYQYLGLWPQHLFQTLTGPEEQIERLREKGLEVTFDIGEISKAELDALRSSQEGFYEDEVSYIVPERWKKVAIPFKNNTLESFNDPEATQLRLDFLRKEFIPLEGGIPLQVFYPLKSLDTFNPKQYTLAADANIQSKNGVFILSTPLLVYEVSRLFLDIVRNNLEIIVTGAPKSDKKGLSWNVTLVSPQTLENQYVSHLATRHNLTLSSNHQGSLAKQREEMWRNRFREYMQKLTLYKSKAEKFSLESHLEEKR